MKIIGYEAERKRLQVALDAGAKFILVEGALGTGKTTIVKEALAKRRNVRVIGAGKTALEQALEYDLVKRGFLSALINRLKGLDKVSAEMVLRRYNGQPLVLFLDDAKDFDETALVIKNVVTENPKLQAIITLTPEQKSNFFLKNNEVAYRFSNEAVVTLKGIEPPLRRAFIDEYKNPKIEYAPQAYEYIETAASAPQEIIDVIKNLEILAGEAGNEKVDAQTIARIRGGQKIARVTQKKNPLQPQEEQIIALLENHLDGLKPNQIGSMLELSTNTLYARLYSLKQKKLVHKQSGKYYLLRAGERGLGA